MVYLKITQKEFDDHIRGYNAKDPVAHHKAARQRLYRGPIAPASAPPEKKSIEEVVLPPPVVASIQLPEPPAAELPVTEGEGKTVREVLASSVQGTIPEALIEAVERGPPPPRLSRRSIREKIFEVVCRRYNLTIEKLTSERRRVPEVEARHRVAYLARTLITPQPSFPLIGRMLGGRDHTTALHGYKKIKAQLEVDDALRKEIEELTAEVMSQPE